MHTTFHKSESMLSMKSSVGLLASSSTIFLMWAFQKDYYESCRPGGHTCWCELGQEKH